MDNTVYSWIVERSRSPVFVALCAYRDALFRWRHRKLWRFMGWEEMTVIFYLLSPSFSLYRAPQRINGVKEDLDLTQTSSKKQREFFLLSKLNVNELKCSFINVRTIT